MEEEFQVADVQASNKPSWLRRAYEIATLPAAKYGEILARYPGRTILGTAAAAAMNAVAGNPVGGVVDALTLGATNLKPDEETPPASVVEAAPDNPNVAKAVSAKAFQDYIQEQARKEQMYAERLALARMQRDAIINQYGERYGGT